MLENLQQIILEKEEKDTAFNNVSSFLLNFNVNSHVKDLNISDKNFSHILYYSQEILSIVSKNKTIDYFEVIEKNFSDTQKQFLFFCFSIAYINFKKTIPKTNWFFNQLNDFNKSKLLEYSFSFRSSNFYKRVISNNLSLSIQSDFHFKLIDQLLLCRLTFSGTDSAFNKLYDYFINKYHEDNYSIQPDFLQKIIKNHKKLKIHNFYKNNKNIMDYLKIERINKFKYELPKEFKKHNLSSNISLYELILIFCFTYETSRCVNTKKTEDLFKKFDSSMFQSDDVTNFLIEFVSGKKDSANLIQNKLYYDKIKSIILNHNILLSIKSKNIKDKTKPKI